MKPLLLVLLFAGIGATGLTLAQNQIAISSTNKVTSITIDCNLDAALCKRLAKKSIRPPAPPAPPAPPVPPEASEPPEPPELAELADLPDFPEPPEPPLPPPPPPKVVIPKEVHRACQGKKVGEEAHWRIGSKADYTGICRQQQGELQLDVRHIKLND